MELSNDIVLRPRFQRELTLNKEAVIQAFLDAKKIQKNFIITQVDDHIFIKLPKKEQHFWSPQLHLEVEETAEKHTLLKGLFGPNPTVWTMFMFFHFVVAGLFFGFGTWAFSNHTLNKPYSSQIILLILMVVAWFVLYFAGRIGKSTGSKEMAKLNRFMKDTLNLQENNQ
ncbi:MAG: GTP-binding protein [Flavobacteriaceae bacterium]|nr:GTP-binding protein [Flavobacteriaceae bacterium]